MTNPTSWRRALRIHPAADLFPMMHEDELLALGQDIEKNTLREPIVCFEGQLLDGRNRLDAMESVGMKLVAGNGEFNWAQVPTRDVTGCDPYEFVASANIHRRHLTAEQKRELVEKLIKAEPTRSDRQIAEQIKSNRTTVGQIRKRLEKAGDVSIVDTRTDRKGRQQPATKPPTRAVTAAAVRAEERAAKAAPQTDQEIEPSPSPQQPKEESPAPPRSATGAANKPDQMGVAHDQDHVVVTCLTDVHAYVLPSVKKAFDVLDAKHRAELLGGLRQFFRNIEGWEWPGQQAVAPHDASCGGLHRERRAGADSQQSKEESDMTDNPAAPITRGEREDLQRLIRQRENRPRNSARQS